MEGRIVQWQLRRKQRRKRNTKSFTVKHTGDAKSVPEVFWSPQLSIPPSSLSAVTPSRANNVGVRAGKFSMLAGTSLATMGLQLARLAAFLAGTVYTRFSVAGHRLR
jgi:hypothetical protein